MKVNITAIASVLAVFTCAPLAQASTGVVTYQGIVNNTQVIGKVIEPLPDVDVEGLFGGGNLEGDPLTASFSYTTSLGMRSGDGATYDQLTGGSSFLTSNPITSVTFTIAGHSYTYKPNYYELAYTQSAASGDGGFVEDVAYDIVNNQIGDQAFAGILADDAPASLTTSFSSGLAPTGGSFFDPASNTLGADAINFDTISVAVSAIPEPSSWALMIVGVGLTGVALRKRSYNRRSSKKPGAVLGT